MIVLGLLTCFRFSHFFFFFAHAYETIEPGIHGEKNQDVTRKSLRVNRRRRVHMHWQWAGAEHADADAGGRQEASGSQTLET